MRLQMGKAEQRLGGLVSQLESLSPLNVLKRGYSLTRRESGTVIRQPHEVSPGEVIVTELSTGRLLSRVERVENSSGMKRASGDADE